MSTLKLVYGTRSKKWHLVDSTDRDYAHGLTPELKRTLTDKQAIALYLAPRLV